MMRYVLLLSILWITACAPAEQDFQYAPFEQSKFTSKVFHQADGVDLPYRAWHPKKTPNAVIIGLHGFNDYSNAFKRSGEFFSKHDVAFYAYDQRGFGESEYIGIWAGEENLIMDLKYFVRQVSKRHPNVPIYVLGESMGAAVAVATLAQKRSPKVKGVILVAPAIWGAETMNGFYRFTLWLTAHTIPSYELTGGDLKIQASNNIPMLRALSKDPLVIKHTRVDAIYGIVGLMDNAYRNVRNVKVPVMMLYGAKDEVIPLEPIERALLKFTVPVHYAYYKNSYHMILRDLQGEKIMADILSWITNPAASFPSGVKVVTKNQ